MVMPMPMPMPMPMVMLRPMEQMYHLFPMLRLLLMLMCVPAPAHMLAPRQVQKPPPVKRREQLQSYSRLWCPGVTTIIISKRREENVDRNKYPKKRKNVKEKM